MKFRLFLAAIVATSIASLTPVEAGPLQKPADTAAVRARREVRIGGVAVNVVSGEPLRKVKLSLMAVDGRPWIEKCMLPEMVASLSAAGLPILAQFTLTLPMPDASRFFSTSFRCSITMPGR